MLPPGTDAVCFRSGSCTSARTIDIPYVSFRPRATYVSVEPFHLFRYLDEQTFRYNELKVSEVEGKLDGLIDIVAKWDSKPPEAQ